VERLEGDSRRLVWPPPDAADALREVVSLSRVGGALWIGTASAGAYLFNPESAGGAGNSSEGQGTATPSLPTPIDALAERGTLWSAVEDGAGGIVVGTSRGLFRLSQDRTDVWLPGVDVRAVALAGAPGDGVWCATVGSGLVRVRVDGSVGTVTARVGTDHGLPSDGVYALSISGAPQAPVLALGTNRGVATYEPSRRPPGLRIGRVVGRRAYAPSEWPSIRLDAPQESLLVEMAAVGGRTYPEHYQYVFTLTPEAGPPRSSLAHDGQFLTGPLPAGRYVVEGRALGTDLVASAPVHLSFEVARAPLPWVSIGLGGLLLVALFALGWGTSQNRRLAKSSAALAKTRLQLVQETENERRRIARDLHDQTLADLRRLLLSGNGAGATAASETGGTFREAVEAISTEIRRICEDLSPSVLENVGLTAALEWALVEAVAQANAGKAEGAAHERRAALAGAGPCRGSFVCADDVEDELHLDGAARIQVYRIVQEALTNAVRHSGCTELVVTVLNTERALVVTVEDNGRGIKEPESGAGRGLANMRSRASLIGARVDWSARPDGGTTFSLRVPRPSLG
jgi:signal transduction histidine kinase